MSRIVNKGAYLSLAGTVVARAERDAVEITHILHCQHLVPDNKHVLTADLAIVKPFVRSPDDWRFPWASRAADLGIDVWTFKQFRPARVVNLQELSGHFAMNTITHKYRKLTVTMSLCHDPERFAKFSQRSGSQTITEPILATLLDPVREAHVETYRDKMFAGKYINTSEDHAVLHNALRNFDDFKISKAGMDEVDEVLAHMREFIETIRRGEWKGYTGKTINTIVNIGFSGSDLDRVKVTKALKPYAKRDLHAYLVPNIDGTHLTETLRLCDPERTLFITASKTFTTQETITNTESARD
ncbi:Phosphoglucose isomerase-domain-containing protein [Cubamyces lactineus]|nr:Phosphoglucose isomerase-domain-containing protein [Cubamyces lactineus]